MYNSTPYNIGNDGGNNILIRKVYIYNICTLTLYPEDLKWQPRLVSVDFILMQNALSKPLYAFVLDRDITDETENITK